MADIGAHPALLFVFATTGLDVWGCRNRISGRFHFTALLCCTPWNCREKPSWERSWPFRSLDFHMFMQLLPECLVRTRLLSPILQSRQAQQECSDLGPENGSSPVIRILALSLELVLRRRYTLRTQIHFRRSAMVSGVIKRHQEHVNARHRPLFRRVALVKLFRR